MNTFIQSITPLQWAVIILAFIALIFWFLSWRSKHRDTRDAATPQAPANPRSYTKINLQYGGILLGIIAVTLLLLILANTDGALWFQAKNHAPKVNLVSSNSAATANAPDKNDEIMKVGEPRSYAKKPGGSTQNARINIGSDSVDVPFGSSPIVINVSPVISPTMIQYNGTGSNVVNNGRAGDATLSGTASQGTNPGVSIKQNQHENPPKVPKQPKAAPAKPVTTNAPSAPTAGMSTNTFDVVYDLTPACADEVLLETRTRAKMNYDLAYFNPLGGWGKIGNYTDKEVTITLLVKLDSVPTSDRRKAVVDYFATKLTSFCSWKGEIGQYDNYTPLKERDPAEQEHFQKKFEEYSRGHGAGVAPYNQAKQAFGVLQVTARFKNVQLIANS
jgi:hypothetical protein